MPNKIRKELVWTNNSNERKMIMFLSYLLKGKLSSEDDLGLNSQTIGYYSAMLLNDPAILFQYFYQQTDSKKATNSEKLKIKELKNVDRYKAYASTIHRIGLVDRSKWECLSLTGKKVFVWSRINNHLPIEDIAEKEFKIFNSIAYRETKEDSLESKKADKIKKVALELSIIKDLDNPTKYTYSNVQNIQIEEEIKKFEEYFPDEDELEEFNKYLEAEKTFDDNIELRIINVEWNSLKSQSEKMLHVLFLKYQGMSEEEMTKRWKIEKRIVEQYYKIAKYLSFEKIHSLLIEETKKDKNTTDAEILLEEFFAEAQAIELEQLNSHIEEKRKVLLDKLEDKTETVIEWKNMNNFEKTLFYLLIKESGSSTNKSLEKIKNRPATVEHYKNVLRNEWKVQEEFFKKGINLGTTIKYDEEYDYSCIVNGIGLGNKTLWSCLSPKGKQAFIWSRQKAGRKLTEIALEAGLEKEYGAVLIRNFIWKCNNKKTKPSKKEPKSRTLTDKEKQKYENAEKNLQALFLTDETTVQSWSQKEKEVFKKVEPILEKVEWATLSSQKKLFCILKRKHFDMSEKLIAHSLNIEEELVNRYFNIINYLSAEEIFNFSKKENFLEKSEERISELQKLRIVIEEPQPSTSAVKSSEENGDNTLFIPGIVPSELTPKNKEAYERFKDNLTQFRKPISPPSELTSETSSLVINDILFATPNFSNLIEEAEKEDFLSLDFN